MSQQYRCSALALLALAACVSSEVVLCENGQTCPAATACATLETGDTVCVSLGQVDACAGLADGMACTRAGGTGTATCHGGACFDDQCGNALVDASEVCDDGNGIADDACSLDCMSTNACGNGITDVAVGEECDTRDAADHDGCSSACRSESPHWSLVDLQHPATEPTRFAPVMTYDAARRRTVLFGGGPQLNDTWEYDGLRWRKLAPPLSPSPRRLHSMAYDAARAEVVMFGGVNTPADTWTWNGSTWQLRQPTSAPNKRASAAMAYDSARRVVVLFGGNESRPDGSNQYDDDTWIWDGSDWHQVVTTPKPPGRGFASMAYDPKRNVTVLFGGNGSAGALGDTWEFDGSTWAMKASTGAPARSAAPMAFDPVSQQVMIVDGFGSSAILQDAWAWNGAQWMQLTRFTGPSTVTQTGLPTMATDTTRGVAVLLDAPGNLYELKSTGWGRSATGSYTPPGGPSQPTQREAHIAVTDSAKRQIVIFGGTYASREAGVPLGDTWTWDGVWHSVAGGPSARMGAAAAYDSIRKRTVLFGGCDEEPSINPKADTWLFDGTTWTQQTGGAQPSGRCFAQMTFDAKRGRVVLHGGEFNGTPIGDTWTWDGTWHPENPPTAGPAVAQAAMGYDPDREQVVLFGGKASNGKRNDTWTWDGSNWTKLPPNVVQPAARIGSQLAWDAARRRLIMHGGNGMNGNSIGDTWEWDGATTAWQLSTAGELGALEFFGLVPALEGAGVIAVGGHVLVPTEPDEREPTNDLWLLRWDGVSPTDRCAGIDNDGDGLVGCLDPDCTTTCTGCGDGVCDPLLEQCVSCPMDCGACPATCGDFTCTAGEACPGDCP